MYCYTAKYIYWNNSRFSGRELDEEWRRLDALTLNVKNTLHREKNKLGDEWRTLDS